MKLRQLSLGFLLGAVTTGIAAWLICGVRLSVERGVHTSAVAAPVRMALEDIVGAYEAGADEAAEAKVRLLEARWQAYWKNLDPRDLNSPESLNIAISQAGQPATSQPRD